MPYSNIRIWTDCSNPHGDCGFLAESLAPRHGGLIPSWDGEEGDVSGETRTPPAERITTRYPNLELEAEYEAVMEPVNEKFHEAFDEKWKERKKVVLSKKYDVHIRRILVDMLGGLKKDKILNELLSKIDSATSTEDFMVCVYTYKEYKYKSQSTLPITYEIFESTQVEGDDICRPTFHDLFVETDLLDRFLQAFGKDFNYRRTNRIFEETPQYILYEHSVMLSYHPGLADFLENYE
jgi:hypothetical protein